jgi:hypothetical protein
MRQFSMLTLVGSQGPINVNWGPFRPPDLLLMLDGRLQVQTLDASMTRRSVTVIGKVGLLVGF